jgi:dTDP-L-rhamnose 4-epimerase
VDALAAHYRRIVVLDSLHPQVHGPNPAAPSLPANVIFKKGRIENRRDLADAIAEADPQIVYHLAAETGTGQSFDEISRYCDVNVIGTALLVEELKRRASHLERFVLASSRAVYGEGAHRDHAGNLVVPEARIPERLQRKDFQPQDGDGDKLIPEPTPETFPPHPSSIYAATKLMQEQVARHGFAGTGVLPVVLRFQNVFGPGQSLRNPYTGVLSIFCSQILAGKTLNIYEDGEIVRDFVYVDDVVSALTKAGSTTKPGVDPINIGSGEGATILNVARKLLHNLGRPETQLTISGNFRPGDIRYAVADIRRAAERLGWQPKISLEEGLVALADWAHTESQAR